MDKGKRFDGGGLGFVKDVRFGCAICLAIAVAPPIAIFCLYAIDVSCMFAETPWNAGEILGYCGAISAAAIALFGVAWSINNGWRLQREQNREAAAPYFSMVVLEPKNRRGPLPLTRVAPDNDSLLEDSADSPNEYYEAEVREVYVILNDIIGYKRSLDEKEREHVESRFVQKRPSPGVVLTVLNPVIYLPLRFRNTGQGCANGVRVGVNRKDDEWNGVCSWSLDHGDDFYLGLYVDTDAPGVFGEYEIRIVFYDCLGYKYRETFELIVDQSDSGQPKASIDYVGRKTILE